MLKRLFVGSFLLLFFLFAIKVSAQTVLPKGVATSETAVSLERDQVVNRDYFAAGESVHISGTINGDLYAAGGQIIIDGVVNGDVLAAGGSILISGEVAQDVRVAGGTITIDGSVGQNLTVAGGNVVLGKTAKVDGSIVAGVGNLTLAAPIAGNVLGGVGQLTVSNQIGGDLETGVGQLSLTSDAKVGGDLTYWSNQEASIGQAASIAGVVQMNKPEVNQEKFDQAKKEIERAKGEAAKVGQVVKPVFEIIGALAFLLIGTLLIRFFPKYTESVANTVQKSPWKSLLVGFLVIIVAPFAFVLLLVTVLGIPLAFIMLAMLMIYSYLAKFGVILWAGMEASKRLAKKTNLYMSFVLGLVIYLVISLIPVIGAITKIFVFLFGLGALLITCQQTYAEAKKKSLV